MEVTNYGAKMLNNNEKWEKELLCQTISLREDEILELYGSGAETKEIAQTLFITKSAVNFHRTNIMKKIGLNNYTEFVSFATWYLLIKEGK